MTSMNWIDIVILGIFFFSAMAGLARGLIGEVVSLASLIASFVVAIMFASPLSKALLNSPMIQGLINQVTSSTGINTEQAASYLALGISFGLLFAGTAMVGSVISYLFGAAFQTGVLGFGNRILGAGFGLIRGYILNLVLIFLVQLTPLSNYPVWQQSQFVHAYQPSVQWLGTVVSPLLSNLKAKVGTTLQDVGSTLQNFTH